MASMEPQPPPPPPPPAPPPFRVLPRRSELSSGQIEFLDQHLGTHEDLRTRAPLLLTDLTKSFTDFEANFQNLQRNLTKRTVSWISRSFGAKSTLTNLNLKLENLSLHTSQYGICSRKIQKILGQELPQLAKCLKQIENIRKYVDTALQLEALVGDLEDAVYYIGDHHARNLFSSKLLTSLISTDFGPKQERLLRAIKVMNNIEDVLVEVVKFHSQWSHLLESVDVRVDKILAIVRPQILADHRALLGSLGWPPKLLTSKVDSGEVASLPNPLVLMEGDKRRYYSQSFLGLCALQHLQTRREERQHNIFGRKECCMKFWAIDELVSPIASRMEHHFSKWAEQPEFMFALVYKITRDFIVGVDDVLQPLIDRARLVSYSAREAWVSAMVQMLSGFLAKAVVSVLAERYKEKHMKSEVISSWLHLIDHAVAFDKRMQSLVSSEIHFLEESERHDSRGLSVLMIFCGRPDWLKMWAKVELKDAWKKLKSELKDERAWSINEKSRNDFQISGESEQFLLATREDYKAPLVTESALKIAWEMIERCRTLPAVLPQIRFIRSTAGRFLWHFLNVLVFRCKNIKYPLDNPNDALIKVCGSINAARYVESKLQEWSDDVNFLEMRIAERDLEINGNDDGLYNNSFFGEEVKSLLELETNWLMDIIAVLLRQFEELSWEYLQTKRYFEQGQENFTLNEVPPAAMDVAVSNDIVEALDAIKSQLNILKSSLNSKDFLDLWRSIADGLDRFISSSISTSEIQFSSWGINQFEADMRALFLVFGPFCARPEAFFPCIRETLKLLKMCREEANHLQVVTSNDKNQTKCLHTFGISHLSFDQVDKVLRNRKFGT